MRHTPAQQAPCAASSDVGRPWRRSLAALAAVASLAGCASGLEVTSPAQAGSPECAALAAAWPERVADHARVQVRDDPTGVAAWGDPAIIARCGVAPPAPTTKECISVDDVDWVVDPLSDGTRFTSYGRSPAVEILVPRAYAPEPLVLGAFTDAARHLPATQRRCS